MDANAVETSVAAREPARGYFAAPVDLAVNGLARQRRFLDRERRPPAIHHLTGLLPTYAAPGRTTFSMPASPWLLGAAGALHGGVAALVADAPLSGAVITELGPGQLVTTASLSLQFVRPAFPSSQRIVADARSVHVGRQLGLSSCDVTDAAGRLLAHGSARNVVLTVDLEDIQDEQQMPVDPDAGYDDPDPWRRPVEGEPLSAEAWDRPGLELAEAWCAGELPAAPVSVLTGCMPDDCGDGWAEWVAPTSPWWCSPAPYLFGGLLALFAEATLSGAFLTVSPPGLVAAAVDLNVRFVRPVFPNTGLLRARAEVVHAGRNLRAGRCTIRDEAGKIAVLAESSATLVPPQLLEDSERARTTELTEEA